MSDREEQAKQRTKRVSVVNVVSVVPCQAFAKRVALALKQKQLLSSMIMKGVNMNHGYELPAKPGDLFVMCKSYTHEGYTLATRRRWTDMAGATRYAESVNPRLKAVVVVVVDAVDGEET